MHRVAPVALLIPRSVSAQEALMEPANYIQCLRASQIPGLQNLPGRTPVAKLSFLSAHGYLYVTVGTDNTSKIRLPKLSGVAPCHFILWFDLNDRICNPRFRNSISADTAASSSLFIQDTSVRGTDIFNPTTQTWVELTNDCRYRLPRSCSIVIGDQPGTLMFDLVIVPPPALPSMPDSHQDQHPRHFPARKAGASMRTDRRTMVVSHFSDFSDVPALGPKAKIKAKITHIWSTIRTWVQARGKRD